MQKFPKDFIFGAATSAYQAEGAINVEGKGKTMWEDYLAENANFSPDMASDFYHKYKEDLELAKEYGINGIRISISWSRIFPQGVVKEVNIAGVQYYHDLLDACIENGIEPFVTLHHFDTPKYLFDLGDWLSSRMVEEYVKFGKFCFEEYGNKVKKWITINEPWSLVAGQYIIGHFPPNIKYDIAKSIQAMHNMLVGHAKLVNIYKSKGYTGEIGIVHILESKYPLTNDINNEKAAQFENVLANQFLLDGTLRGEYTEETMKDIENILRINDEEFHATAEDLETMKRAALQIDFLGMNYYASHFLIAYEGESNIHHNGTGKKGSSIFALKGIGERRNNPLIPTTDWDWPIYPQGMEDMLCYLKKRYPNLPKIYITENGMGDRDVLVDGKVWDSQRIDYIRSHLKAILESQKSGINISGYFVWSLIDVFSWTNGYNKRYGLFYVDFDTQERYIKESARWYKKIATSLSLDEKI